MKVLIIGAGKMGEAILKVWLSKSSRLKIKVTVLEVDTKKANIIQEKYSKIHVIKKISSMWKGDILVLAVKPQTFNSISFCRIFEKINVKIIISIMAGISLNNLKNSIKKKVPYLRAMPNLATIIGKGVTGIYSRAKIKKIHKNKIKELFEAMGSVFWLKKEDQFDPLTAISGSGPAYFFLFLLTLRNTAKNLGFTNKMANELVLNTADGALGVYKNNSNLEKLISDVTSPGGTTEAALKVLLKNRTNLINIMEKAILAANKRSKMLGKSAKRL